MSRYGRQVSSLAFSLILGSLAHAQWYPYYPPAPPQYAPTYPYGYYPQGPQQQLQRPAPERQEGEDVQKAQAQLKELRFHNGAIDGVAGPNTRSALMRFQREHGLTPDGILGPATKRELDQRAARKPSSSSNLTVRSESSTSAKPAATPRPRATPRPAARVATEGTSNDKPVGSSSSRRTETRRSASDTTTERSVEPVADDEESTPTVTQPVSAVPRAARTPESDAPAEEAPVSLDKVPAAAPKAY